MKIASFCLDDVLKAAEFSSSEIEAIHKGQLIKGVVDAHSDRELAVKFAFLLENADLATVQDTFMDSALKTLDPAVNEVGHLIAEGTTADSSDDFANIALLEGDAGVKLYRSKASGPGDDLNLSAEEIAEFQKLGKHASKDDLESLLRKQLASRYQAYRELGLKGIAPYQRSKSKSYSPGEELRHKTAMMNFLQQTVPEFYQYVLEYPAAPKPDGLLETFSWTVSILDDLPTIALVHKVGYPHNGAFIFFTRMFYVNRSHNSVQAIGGSFPGGGGEGTTTSILVYVTRTSTDRVAGFGGAAKRAVGSRIMSTKQAENFERLRQVMKEKK